MRRSESGFTLLEVLVASVIMAIAVAGTLSALSGSTRNAARLTDSDRASMLAKRKMDELLVDAKLPRFVVIEGQWNPVMTGGRVTGWKALVRPWEFLPTAVPGSLVLERIELEVWWNDGTRRRALKVEGFRRGMLTEADIAAGALIPQ